MYFSHVSFSHGTFHLNKSRSQHLENTPHAYLYWILCLPHLKQSSFYGEQMFFSLMPFYSHVLALFNNSSVHLGIPERVIVLQIRSEPCRGSELVCHSAAGHSSGQESLWWPFTYVFLKQYSGSLAKDLFYRLGIFSPWINEQAQVRVTLSRQRAGPKAEEGKFALGESDMKDFLFKKHPEISCSFAFFPETMNFAIPLENGVSYRNHTEYLTKKCKKSILLERNFRI